MTWHSRWLSFAVVPAICLTSTEFVWAHAGHRLPYDNAWTSGAMHPLLGLDHLLAMLASGLLAVRIGTSRALWVVPLSFVALMLFGAGLAMFHVPLPAAEGGIALSVIVLSLIVAMQRRLPLRTSAALVALFAICHGHAHVMEAGSHASLPFLIGFIETTLGLHATAIGFGLLARRWAQPHLIRFAGAGIAACFTLLLFLR